MMKPFAQQAVSDSQGFGLGPAAPEVEAEDVQFAFEGSTFGVQEVEGVDMFGDPLTPSEDMSYGGEDPMGMGQQGAEPDMREVFVQEMLNDDDTTRRYQDGVAEQNREAAAQTKRQRMG